MRILGTLFLTLVLGCSDNDGPSSSIPSSGDATSDIAFGNSGDTDVTSEVTADTAGPSDTGDPADTADTGSLQDTGTSEDTGLSLIHI